MANGMATGRFFTRYRSDARGKRAAFVSKPQAAQQQIEAWVFGDLDQAIGQIEHLSLLHPRLHRHVGEAQQPGQTLARKWG